GEYQVFELTGKRLEQIVIMSDMYNEEAVKRVYDVLNKLGVTRRLVSLGAEDGDILIIGKEEIVFLNLLN
ncbi:Obg family GTPase CgtA, partial [Patescibacteria group bacterium]|nr:Obg family GTPase CgtA [Patescibacteria group bacterium]